MKKKTVFILVSFGEPRNEKELPSYVQSCFREEAFAKKGWISRLFHLGKIRKEISRIKKEYQIIGAASAYEQLIQWKEEAAKYLQGPVFCFFLHLPSTHAEFFQEIRNANADEYILLPSFPQFSYAHAGQIARFFAANLKKELLHRFRWIKSFVAHPAFVEGYQKIIRESLKKNAIKEEEAILLFSCMGIDPNYLENGDLYQGECEISFKEILKAFPFALGKLSYQNPYKIRSSPLYQKPYQCFFGGGFCMDFQM